VKPHAARIATPRSSPRNHERRGFGAPKTRRRRGLQSEIRLWRAFGARRQAVPLAIISYGTIGTRKSNQCRGVGADALGWVGRLGSTDAEDSVDRSSTESAPAPLRSHPSPAADTYELTRAYVPLGSGDVTTESYRPGSTRPRLAACARRQATRRTAAGRVCNVSPAFCSCCLAARNSYGPRAGRRPR
jgi:hypothetical protein